MAATMAASSRRILRVRFLRGPIPLRHIVTPFMRTGRFYAQSWQDYLTRESDGLPVARPTLAPTAQAFVDELVMAGFRLFRRMSDLHGIERIENEVVAALEFYQRNG